MASIWFLKAGELQEGEPIDNKSLDFCFNHLGLRQRDWIAPLDTKGSLVDPGRAPALGQRYAIVEIRDQDLSPTDPGWQTGYYRLRMDATEVRKRLES